MDSREEQAVDFLQGSVEESDVDGTQCSQADRILSNVSHSRSSSEASQGDPAPESSQRNERQQNRQTKQQSAHEALKEAQKM